MIAAITPISATMIAPPMRSIVWLIRSIRSSSRSPSRSIRPFNPSFHGVDAAAHVAEILVRAGEARSHRLGQVVESLLGPRAALHRFHDKAGRPESLHPLLCRVPPLVIRPRRPFIFLAAAASSLALALGVSACGGGDDDNDTTTAASKPTSAFAQITPVDRTNCQDVQYGGSGDPTKLIVSDEPLQGDSAERSQQMNDATVQELDNENWKARKTDVALQICDDSIAATGEWDEATCTANAEAYAKNPDVIGVIGTYNSGCAALEIPILNTAPDGGVPMVSPGNTLVCLTEPSTTSCAPDEPDKYYPNGGHNYIRVIPNDAFQGAGLAEFAKDEQQVEKPYVLYPADDQQAAGAAGNVEGAAKALGMQIAGKATWNPNAASYTDLMNQVKKSG